MTSRTHDLTTLTALNLVLVTQPLPQLSLATAVVSRSACFLGGLLPDIDEPTSEFWQRVPAGRFFGELLRGFIGSHRQITHSLLGLTIAGFITRYILYLFSESFLIDMDLVWNSFMIGYIPHLIVDSLTKEGIPLFFPILFFGNIYLFYKNYEVYLGLFKMFLKKG